MNVRLPEDLKSLVEAAAKDNNRSMNAEIVWRLGESFRAEVRTERDLRNPKHRQNFFDTLNAMAIIGLQQSSVSVEDLSTEEIENFRKTGITVDDLKRILSGRGRNE
jgi:hypothetical protein